MRAQRDQLLKKKQEERQQEITQYQSQQAEKQGNNEEEEKNQRIKKGLQALSMNQQSEDDIKKKRINFMADIRDALITGDVTGEGEVVQQKKLKKKKQKTEQPDSFL